MCAASARRRAGYSPKTATTIGLQLLNKPHIAEALREGQAESVKRAEIQVDDILKRYWDVMNLGLSKLTQHFAGEGGCWAADHGYGRSPYFTESGYTEGDAVSKTV